MDMRSAELDVVNTATKYPSIPTYHQLDPRNGRLNEHPLVFAPGGAVQVTEKVDGTNGRIVVFPCGGYVIGSREELLWARGDLGGLPVRRLWECGRFTPPHEPRPVALPWPETSMAAALGWPSGHRVVTRGARRTSGGNAFPADVPAWCVTSKARSWRRGDGRELSPSEAGLLVGFEADYPWRGPRSQQFLQAADAVSPAVGAAVLGAAAGLEWRGPVRSYLERIYPGAGAGRRQMDLFTTGEAS